MAYGDLGAVIDTLAYYDDSSRGNESLLVAGQICAVTFHHQSYYTPCKTFSIDALGNISDAVIDELNLNDAVMTDNVKSANVFPSIYAIATRDNHFKVQVDTWRIYGNGAMDDAVLDHYAFPPEYWHPSKLKKVGPGYLALAVCNDSATTGQIWTIKVYGDGTIERDLVDTMTFITTHCPDPHLSNMHPGIWVVVHRGPTGQGNLHTISISAGGILGASPINSMLWTTGGVQESKALKARDNFLAIAHRNQTNQGELVTVEIDETGQVTEPPIDTYIFDTGATSLPFPFSMGRGYIGVAYRNAAGHGILKTFLVDENGHLNNTTIDTLDYAPDGSNIQNVFHVAGDVWAVTYETAGPSGRVTTFGLETPPPLPAAKDLMRGMLR